MYDTIEKIGRSIIQHGHSNARIYLMKLDKSDYPAIIGKMNNIAAEHGYSKIFAKIPAWAASKFEANGFIKEAFIPNFYHGKTDVVFYARFLDPARALLHPENKQRIDKILNLALSKQNKPLVISNNPDFLSKILTETDIPRLAKLYATVFKSYPFPIFEENYLKKTMRENIIYFGIFYKDNLIAASSAEMDQVSQNSEMTDFATDPQFTGNNLSLILLREMEAEMRKKNIKTLYTIARSYSAGMNITFAKLNYQFSGTLVNNTDIFGKIESMNVWYKSLK